MKTEYRIFVGLAAFFLLAAGVYWFWTYAEYGSIEVIGVTALILSAMLVLMGGGYFWFVSRRIEPRPEDRLDGEIADGAGEVGFFSPGSYWPFGLALTCAVLAIGLVFMMWWLIIASAVFVLIATSGMLFEYYTGTRRAAEH